MLSILPDYELEDLIVISIRFSRENFNLWSAERPRDNSSRNFSNIIKCYLQSLMATKNRYHNVILTKFKIIFTAAPEVLKTSRVILKISSAASNENFIKMKTFLWQEMLSNMISMG